MNTENIAHYFYGSAPAEDELKSLKKLLEN